MAQHFLSMRERSEKNEGKNFTHYETFKEQKKILRSLYSR